jgi:hypothetical protein
MRNLHRVTLMIASTSNPRQLQKEEEEEELKWRKERVVEDELVRKGSLRRRMLVIGVETSGREERLRFLGK